MIEKTLGDLTAYGENNDVCDYLDSTQQEAAGCNSSKTVFDPVNNMINVAIGVAAVVAVIMIIVGGINYTISQGDSSKIEKARNTIIYGVVGLAVAILAFAIVTFIATRISE